MSIRVYSAEKTLADAFKYRNKIGLDAAIGASLSFSEADPGRQYVGLTDDTGPAGVPEKLRTVLNRLMNKSA